MVRAAGLVVPAVPVPASPAVVPVVPAARRVVPVARVPASPAVAPVVPVSELTVPVEPELNGDQDPVSS